MPHDEPSPRSRLDAIRARTGARAAGWWRVSADGRTLDQVAFSPADDLPAEVASAFAAATLSVPLAATDLGIVRAALTRSVAVSRADAIPAESGSGSGFWLRRFAATRSVAVPLLDPSGAVRAVVAVALGASGIDDEAAARAVLDAVASWPQS